MYYYIDDNGKKQKYVGKVYVNMDGSKCGVLISHRQVNEKVYLTYTEAVPAVEGHPAYFTYAGTDEIYTGPYMHDGTTYITNEQIMNEIRLTHHDAVKAHDAYFTYMGSDKKEHIYEGPLDKIMKDTKNGTTYSVVTYTVVI